MTSVTFQHLVEGGPLDGLELECEAEFSYDSGVYLEPGHPMNGYNSGYYLERVVVRNEAGHLVPVSDDLYKLLCDHALMLRVSRD